MITPDRIAALIGLIMALVLVARNSALRGVRWSARLQMVLIWAVIIVLTALVYTWLAQR
jgi:amino acid transporter